jgi:predicted  nucleic acid-binding Zn-ribbon protein
MKAKKPDKNVAQMAVLKDIRGLLSATREQALPVQITPSSGPDIQAENVHLEAQVKERDELARKQQAALDRLEAENKELHAKLNVLQSAVDKLTLPKADTSGLSSEVSDLEARKTELSDALSQIEDMLQFKIRELARRISQVYQEAGDTSATRDFRRITNQLEAAENFGEFLRALLRG